MLSKIKPLCYSLMPLLLSSGLPAEPLYDAHMHYNAADAADYSPQQIMEILDRSQVSQAAVTSTPSALAKDLHQHAPDRLIPLLGVYRTPADKLSWPKDAELPARVEKALETGDWRGIGELHLFAKDRHSPVFRRLVELADQYRLPLLLHADPVVIDRVYDIAPQLPVIWAHAGTFPHTDLLADYLQRYPALSVDLSVRDERIAPQGEIRDEWYELFVTYADRFMIGVDTYSLSRWQDYAKVIEKIRQWSGQLPDDIASRLNYQNAAAMFNGSNQRTSP